MLAESQTAVNFDCNVVENNVKGGKKGVKGK